MTSISCKTIAGELLARCLRGDEPDRLPAALVEDQCCSALFGTFVEGLADLFEPSLCETYVRLFSQAIAHARPGTDPAALVERYHRIRTPRPIAVEPRKVFVLSRITLGADIAVTSVVLDAARRRFPNAEIFLAGPLKNYELFAGAKRISPAPVNYRRGSLRDRIAVWDELRQLLGAPDALVLDPDSRLTQLGLLPVCDEDRYRFFESRGYGGAGGAALPELTAAWCGEVLGIRDARPWIAVPSVPGPAGIAVSLGVGENPAKRLPDPFEEQLLALLAETGLPVTVDRGAGGEEAERVTRAIARSGIAARVFDGPFAGFASIVAGSRLYVGYDSAGQHAASAAGVPLISIFAGFPSPRMFARWRPDGPQATVIRVDEPDPAPVLARVHAAISSKVPGKAQDDSNSRSGL